MRRLVRASLVVAGGVQLVSTARVLCFAACFWWLPAELRDGGAAVRSVEAALAAEAEMVKA